MRRLTVLFTAAVFAAALLVAVGASASATYRGKWLSGSGYSTRFGAQTLDTSGTWSVNVGSNGTQITGMVFVTHAACKDSFPPCQFNLPLTLVNWTNATWTNGVLTALGTLDVGTVHFDWTFTLDTTAPEPALLHAAIVGCPYGWQYWDFAGDLAS